MLKNKEIAELLNISPAAVSLALNNKSGVSEELRRKVIALRNGSMSAEFSSIQQRTTYVPELLLIVIKRHGDVIGETPFFMSISETLHEQAAVEGYALQTCYTKPKEDFNVYLKTIDIDRYDGILVLGTEATDDNIQAIMNLGKPTVVIDGWFKNLNVDCVMMDNICGVRQAVRYAYELGHRKIGFIGSYVWANNFEDRFFAYCGELSMLNLPYNPKYVYKLYSTLDGAGLDMCNILEEKPELPTVFICVNDMVAMGVMDALTKYGYSVPNDVSIIGFDNMTVSAHLNPPMTTVGFPVRKIAASSIRVLTDKIKNRHKKTTSATLIKTELIARASTIAVKE